MSEKTDLFTAECQAMGQRLRQFVRAPNGADASLTPLSGDESAYLKIMHLVLMDHLIGRLDEVVESMRRLETRFEQMNIDFDNARFGR